MKWKKTKWYYNSKLIDLEADEGKKLKSFGFLMRERTNQLMPPAINNTSFLCFILFLMGMKKKRSLLRPWAAQENEWMEWLCFGCSCFWWVMAAASGRGSAKRKRTTTQSKGMEWFHFSRRKRQRHQIIHSSFHQQINFISSIIEEIGWLLEWNWRNEVICLAKGGSCREKQNNKRKLKEF